MTWADTVRATALAALAERKVASGRIFASVPAVWNPRDVWLTRITQPRESGSQRSVRDPATPSRHGAPLHD